MSQLGQSALGLFTCSRVWLIFSAVVFKPGFAVGSVAQILEANNKINIAYFRPWSDFSLVSKGKTGPAQLKRNR